MKDLIFLKLGGSLITDKDRPHTALIPQIDMLVGQIREFLEGSPSSRILLGHGSGSFGHHAANKYGTRNGVVTPAEWLGFVEVWHEARTLNQIVIESLYQHQLKPVCFPFSALTVTQDRHISYLPVPPIERALDQGLLPVVYGDVVLDKNLGGTILSTEEQFEILAPLLHPSRILVAGSEAGVWEDFPTCKKFLPCISLNEFASLEKSIGGSTSVDVTGGMLSKVRSLFSIIKDDPEIQAMIFSGTQPGALLQALEGHPIGTMLSA